MWPSRLHEELHGLLQDLGLLQPPPPDLRNDSIMSYKWHDRLVTMAQRLDLLYDGGQRTHVLVATDPPLRFEITGDPARPLTPGSRLSARTQREIHALDAAGTRHLYLLLFWDWWAAGRRRERLMKSHATLLVVDTLRRTYALFDPEDQPFWVHDPQNPPRYAQPIDAYDVLSRAQPLLAGYRFDPTGRQSGRFRLQPVLEARSRKLKGPLHGLCSVLVLFVFNACMRFQCPQPWAVADALVDVVGRVAPTAATRHALRMQLAHWHRRVYTQRGWVELERHVGLLDPAPRPDHRRRCPVISPRLGTFCQRPACPGHALCHQHRLVLLMRRWKRSAGAPCGTPIPWSNNGAVPVLKPPEGPIDTVSSSEEDDAAAATPTSGRRRTARGRKRQRGRRTSA